MSFAQVFDSIGQAGTPSFPEELFRAWRRAEISEADFHIGNAVWVAGNLNKYPPRYFMPFSQPMADYVQSRLAGRRGRDASMGERVGTWLSVLTRLSMENQSDLALLEWSRDLCQSVGLTSQVQSLEAHIARYKSIPYPHEQASKANQVQVMDARDRQRGGS